jgi:hypothetical protein
MRYVASEPAAPEDRRPLLAAPGSENGSQLSLCRDHQDGTEPGGAILRYLSHESQHCPQLTKVCERDFR